MGQVGEELARMQVWRRRRRERIFGTKAQSKRMRMREGGRPLWKLGIPYGGERRERGPLGTKKGKGGGVIKGLEEGERDSTNIPIRLLFRFRKTQRRFTAFLI